MMRRRASILLSACAPLLVACSDPSEDLRSALEKEVGRRVKQAAAQGFSGAILVTFDDERLEIGASGLADRARQIENTEETAFDVGSIMKDMTAAAIYALDEDGALSVSDPLSSILHDVPADKVDITLLQILQHRAGFREYHDTLGDFEPMTREDARARILAQALRFAPGTDEAYSNSGFTLLADVAETVSGESFTSYMRRKVFDRAGMDHSGFYSDARWQTVDTAIGYDGSTFEHNDPAAWPYTWALMGNGGLVTTVVDLSRWFTALWDGRVLGPDALEAMRRDYLAEGAVVFGGQRVYSYAGASDYGFGGVAIDAPETKTRLVMATNAYDSFDIESFARDVAPLLVAR